MTPDLRDAALALAARGWPVFPVKPRGKTPLTAHGFKEATTNPNLIERWWDRHEQANVAVATGKTMRAWVLDVDGAEGSASLTALEAELGALPETLESATGGGGRHLFFAWPEGRVIGNRANVRPGIDVRGEGGYVVVPPSVTERPYAWLTTPDDPIAHAPKPWLDLVCPPPRNVPPWERVSPPAPPLVPRQPLVARAPIVERARRYLAEVEPAIQGNGGHNALLWAARALVVGFELDDATAIGLLWSDYNPRCQPPWNPDDERDRRDLERKVGEARRTPAGKAPGWLLDEFGLRTSTEAMAQIARGAESAALLLASAAKRPQAEQPKPPVEPADAAEGASEPLPYQDFPVGHFPAPVRDFVAMVAESHNVYASFAALPVLVVAGTAMGNAWRLGLKESWVVPPTLWAALIGGPGTNKTAPMELITSALDEPVRADLVATMFNPQGRMKAGDTTVEALVGLMRAGKRGLLCFNDELAAWAKNFDRGKGQKGGGGGGGEQAWLQFWNASRYILDRKTNAEHVDIPAAACSVLGGIQPSLMAEVFDPRRFASGLVARMLIACPPRRQKGWSEQIVTEEATRRWYELVGWLRCTPFIALETNTGRYFPRVVRFDPHAQAAFVSFCNSSGAEMNAETDEHALTLHAKVDTQAARLALVHHGLRIACGERDVEAPVTLASAEAGIAWARWCLAEQLRAYGYTSAVAREESAAELANLIREKLPTKSATTRQVMRLGGGKRWAKAELARSAMAYVVEFGHGRWASEKRDKVVLAEEKST